MIKVISANDSSVFYLNHRRIDIIRQLQSDNLYVILDNGNSYIIKDTFESLKEKVIEFESSITYVQSK